MQTAINFTTLALIENILSKNSSQCVYSDIPPKVGLIKIYLWLVMAAVFSYIKKIIFTELKR